MNSPMPTVAPAPPARRRRWRFVLGAFTVLFAGLAGLWWYDDWAAERDFQAALAETDRLDPGWRMEDILAARPAIPDERNSAKLVGSLRSVRGIWLGEKLENQLFERPMNVRLHPQEVETLRRRLEAVRAARVEAHKLKDMPDGRHDGDYDPVALTTSYQWLQDIRVMLHFLSVDMLLRTEEGEPAEVAAACRAEINAARSIGDEPTLIALLVRIACLEIALGDIQRALAQRELPPEELLKLQALMQREIDEPRLHRTIRGERAIGLKMCEAIRDGRVKRSVLKGGARPSWRDWLTDWLPTGRIDRAGYLRAMNEMVEACKLPVELQADEVTRLRDEWQRRDAVLASQLPGCNKVVAAHTRNQAKMRCALAAVAAERYRQERGSWPNSLERLVKVDYLKTVPIDPYDGKPLRSRQKVNGFLVYSVGLDRIDDGGVIDPTRFLAPGTDIGFELWDAAQRGRPAPLPPPDPGE